MTLYLLDAAGAAFLILVPVVIVLLLIVWGLVEGYFIFLFGINRFWKSIWHAIIINLISLVLGFVIIGIAEAKDLDQYTRLTADPEQIPVWLLYFGLSVVVEGLVLKALNRSITWARIFSASIVMNVVSYAILYAYAYYNSL